MRYILLLYVNDRPQPGTPEGVSLYSELMAFHRECRARGVLLGSNPLFEPDRAVTIRRRGGRTVRTDGPFAETTEWLGGYFLVDCPTFDDARELAALCPTSRYGSVELRPLMELPG
jgi:hypothetical protein